MAKTYTYPHWETHVIDRSIYQALVRETLPLFRPIFFMRAQQGVAGVPVWYPTYNDAVAGLGEGTFTEGTEYFSREALYMKGLFARQGCFAVRMVPDDASFASFVLELRVKKTNVKQYERDANGQYVLDEVTGDRIPLTDATTGVQISEPGVQLKWVLRKMTLTGDHPETLKNLKPTQLGTGADATVVYPILAGLATSAGAFCNDIGIKLFVDLDNLDSTLANNIGSLPYSFGVVKKTYGQDTVSPVYSSMGNQYEDFVAKPEQQDTRVARNVSFEDIIGNYYDKILPFNLQIYSDNIKEIGEIIQDVEEDDLTLFDPFMANLTEAYNIEGTPMPHVIFSTDDDAVALNDTRILYFDGGSDGSITDKDVEALTRQYLKDLIYPEILDQPRYPFTHLFDTGVGIETKKAFIQFLGRHDAFKVVLATADVVNFDRYLTKNEDLSINTPVAV